MRGRARGPRSTTRTQRRTGGAARPPAWRRRKLRAPRDQLLRVVRAHRQIWDNATMFLMKRAHNVADPIDKPPRRRSIRLPRTMADQPVRLSLGEAAG